MKKLFTYLWQHTAIALLCLSLVTTTACTVDEVLSSIDVALQTAAQLSTAIGAVSPADGAVLTLLAGIATKGIQAIQTAYDTYEKDKSANASDLSDALAAAQAVQTNLPQELAALHITDANAQQKATSWVNLMVACMTATISEIQALQGTTASSAAVARAHVAGTVYTLTPEAIQSQWASQVCKGDTKCGALVKVHHKHAKFRF